MCLVVVAHQLADTRPLLVLANRDEYYARPTAPVEIWPEAPDLLAGRDLVAGGTWLGVRGQRWAAVTNFREGLADRTHSHSRGWLVRDYLLGDLTPRDYLVKSMAEGEDYAGFNLLVGAGRELWYGSNRSSAPRQLPPGLYGLSNHQLDTPWPKVVKAKARLAAALQQSHAAEEKLLDLMTDTTRAGDSELPTTGIPLEWERALSAIFIATPEYGTRSSTLLSRRAEGTGLLIERSFEKTPLVWSQRRYELS